MKKIVLCITFAVSSLLLYGAQSPHSKDDQNHKHVVKTDSDLLRILNQTRRQQLKDPKDNRRIFDVDPKPISHNENKKG